MITAYLGLSSNLNNPESQLRQAIQAISAMPQTRLIKTSSFYNTKPMGPQDQPDFINAVVAIETALIPLQLLNELQWIEQQQNRVKTRQWGERTIDCDILLYGDLELKSEILTIPHKGLTERDFVLIPLKEIAPELFENKISSSSGQSFLIGVQS